LQEEIQEESKKPSPKKYVSLESLFTRDYQTKISKLLEEPSVRKVQDTYRINVGAPESIKYTNLGTSCTK